MNEGYYNFYKIHDKYKKMFQLCLGLYLIHTIEKYFMRQKFINIFHSYIMLLLIYSIPLFTGKLYVPVWKINTSDI